MSEPEPEPGPPQPAHEAQVFGDPGSPGCIAFAAAAVAAAVGASVVYRALDPFPIVFVGALIVASFHVAVLALPIYFAIANRYRMNFWIALVAAVLIGALPASVVAILFGGWRDLAGVAGTFGFCGACGGLVFWLALKLGPR